MIAPFQNDNVNVKWPRISIVTPSLNQGQFLEEAIHSVLSQGYPNLEYIVIDGGSTDGSVEIIKKYEKYLSFWISEKDEGYADAINKGLQKSTGEILGWLNADDRYAKGTFIKITETFRKHPDGIVVHGNRILIDQNGKVTGWSCLPPFDPSRSIYTVCSETAFWRRSAMSRVGVLNSELQFAADFEFFCRLYQSGGGKFIKLNEFLGYFRSHPKSKTSRFAQVLQEEAKREWTRLFGSGHQYGEVVVRRSFVHRALDLFFHPGLVGIPYLSNRFSKRFKPSCDE